MPWAPRFLFALISLWSGAAICAESSLPTAYLAAARRAQVPVKVLFAIALQESGMRWRGKFLPWPWTLNIAGIGSRYATRAHACKALKDALRQTAPTRIDAGLGQLNVGFQRHRVERPCDLLDPYRNLALTATILREYHDSGDDWLAAAAHYHHPAGGEFAGRYRARIAEQLARLEKPFTKESPP